MIETLLMSIMFNGQIRSMPPKLLTDSKEHVVIRPMCLIQEKDILSCDAQHVRFRYIDSQTKKVAIRTLTGIEFLRLLLQHILPKGFRRARNFGFLHPNCKRQIHLLQILLRVHLQPIQLKPRPVMICACCGGIKRIIRTRITPTPCANAKELSVTDVASPKPEHIM